MRGEGARGEGERARLSLDGGGRGGMVAVLLGCLGGWAGGLSCLLLLLMLLLLSLSLASWLI